MRRSGVPYRLLVVVLVVGGIGPGGSAAEPQFTAKYEKLDPPEAIAEPIRKLLAPNALAVLDDKGATVMRVWR